MIVVTGADGQLGTAFRSALTAEVKFLTREELDLSDLDRIAFTIAGTKPSCVINCAAYTDVDGAESDEETARTVNGHAVGELAAVCRELGAQFVTFSTDYVFDGTKDGGYVESDRPRPINAYGRSKLLGERLAVEANPDALIVRTSWLLSGTHPNFAQSMLSHLPEGTVSVVNDQFGHPTLVDDLVPAVLEALTFGVVGTLHLADSGTASWYELACEIAEIADIDPERVKPCATEDYPSPASRPRISILDSERLDILGLKPMPSYRGSLVRAVDALIKP